MHGNGHITSSSSGCYEVDEDGNHFRLLGGLQRLLEEITFRMITETLANANSPHWHHRPQLFPCGSFSLRCFLNLFTHTGPGELLHHLTCCYCTLSFSLGVTSSESLSGMPSIISWVWCLLLHSQGTLYKPHHSKYCLVMTSPVQSSFPQIHSSGAGAKSPCGPDSGIVCCTQ